MTKGKTEWVRCDLCGNRENINNESARQTAEWGLLVLTRGQLASKEYLYHINDICPGCLELIKIELASTIAKCQGKDV